MRTRALATLLTLILALAIGASGPLRAFAHGHEGGLVAMVICGEEGATTVYLDASGNPAGPDEACLADPCDACGPSEPTTTGDPSTLPVPPDHLWSLAPRIEADLLATRRTGSTRARGPPIGDDLT